MRSYLISNNPHHACRITPFLTWLVFCRHPRPPLSRRPQPQQVVPVPASPTGRGVLRQRPEAERGLGQVPGRHGTGAPLRGHRQVRLRGQRPETMRWRAVDGH